MTNLQARARRLSDRIQVVVAETLEGRVKDPRLGFTTITEVRISNDLHDATVFYTVLGTDTDRTDTAAALESAKGVLRSEVGRQTGLRFTPTLTFIADVLPESARHIDHLIAAAADADAAVHAQASVATYAGEPDPYRVPRTDEDSLNSTGPLA